MAQRWRGARWLRGVASLAVLALATAGCLPGRQQAREQPDGQGAASGSLLVWDHYVRDVERAVVDTLNQEFEDAHPGVTITRETKSLDDLKTTLGLALQEPDGPDVASVNQGRADMGALVEAGLLLDLTEFGRAEGWFDTFTEGLLKRNMFSADGADFGTGNLYGVAPQAEVVGWYYNKEKLTGLGLSVPTSFEQLQGALAAAAAAGETPIAFGNLDAWPAIHTYGAVEHLFVNTGYLDAFVFGTGDATFDRPENVQAAALVQQWVRQGYFTDNFSGIGYDDSWAQFAAGEAVFMLTGSWISGELDQDEFGFFLTPGFTADDVPPQVGGQGVPFGIRAGTSTPDLAKAYVDWMVSERAAELWADSGALPSREVPADALAEGTLLADIVSGWEAVLANDAVGHYLDWAGPTFYDELTADLQRLLALELSPEEFTAAVQQDYAEGG